MFSSLLSAKMHHQKTALAGTLFLLASSEEHFFNANFRALFFDNFHRVQFSLKHFHSKTAELRRRRQLKIMPNMVSKDCVSLHRCLIFANSGGEKFQILVDFGKEEIFL